MSTMNRPFNRAEYGMIERAIRHGLSKNIAEQILVEVLMAHESDNLAYALVYWGFATEPQAQRYVAELECM